MPGSCRSRNHDPGNPGSPHPCASSVLLGESHALNLPKRAASRLKPISHFAFIGSDSAFLPQHRLTKPERCPKFKNEADRNGAESILVASFQDPFLITPNSRCVRFWLTTHHHRSSHSKFLPSICTLLQLCLYRALQSCLHPNSHCLTSHRKSRDGLEQSAHSGLMTARNPAVLD